MAYLSKKQLGLQNKQVDLERTQPVVAKAMLTELDKVNVNREAHLAWNRATAEFDKLIGEQREACEEPTDVILSRTRGLSLQMMPYESTLRAASTSKRAVKLVLHEPLELKQGGTRETT